MRVSITTKNPRTKRKGYEMMIPVRMKPSRKPSAQPSGRPSIRETRKPTVKRSVIPTTKPTLKPNAPTRKPTRKQTRPTAKPTRKPTSVPSRSPTNMRLPADGGLIYNKDNGMCLAISGTSIVTTSCDSLQKNQLWKSEMVSLNAFILRSNATDMCLTKSSDFALGLYTCITAASSQIWKYDDAHHLRQNSHSMLCATASASSTQVSLSACSNDPYVYNQIWGDFSLYGGNGGSKFAYFICPPGEKVTQITVRAGSWINQLNMTCDNGKVLGPAGSSSGGYFEPGTSCLDGYNGLKVLSGSFAGKLSASCAGSSGSVSFGLAASSYGSGSTDETQCTGNEKIIGFYSQYGEYVDSVNVICGPVQTNPTAKPSIKPSSIPSSRPTGRPSSIPTVRPTARPSRTPSSNPTSRPTIAIITDSNIGEAVSNWLANRSGALSTYGDIQVWDTSRVTNMDFLFYRATDFTGDLSRWDTSRVTSMVSMFDQATDFTCDLSRWDTSRVTSMAWMFAFAASFNGDISTWNTANTTSMEKMFTYASSFDGNVSTWNTTQVTSMVAMFGYASSFSGNLSLWDTAQVTAMEYMFAFAASFNGDLSTWNTAYVTSMDIMFTSASSFDGNVSTWNIARVTSMKSMFAGASSFSGNLSLWDTAQVTSMENMFAYAASFNGNLSTWNTAYVTSMEYMFIGASSFNGDVSNWIDTSPDIDDTSCFISSFRLNTCFVISSLT